MSLTPEELAARAAVQGWYAQQNERVLARQRAQADTAKLLVTFALAVAATLVATALQVASPGWAVPIDAAAVLVLAGGFILTLNVVFLDDLQEPDPTSTEALAVTHGWTDEAKLAALTTITKMTQDRNEDCVNKIKEAVQRQLYTSIIAGGLAAASLFIPLSPGG